MYDTHVITTTIYGSLKYCCVRKNNVLSVGTRFVGPVVLCHFDKTLLNSDTV